MDAHERGIRMSHQFKLCETCTQRHCKKSPSYNPVIHSYVCAKYRKHQEGFGMREIAHEKEKQ